MMHFYLTITTAICFEEVTGFLLWPPTLVGTTRSLPCSNPAIIIRRTCNPSGIWDDVDLSLFISFSSISTVRGGGGSVDTAKPIITSYSYRLLSSAIVFQKYVSPSHLGFERLQMCCSFFNSTRRLCITDI